jgi:oligopeptide/dipeptide ABC transporter ATP-binding protein
MTGPLLEVEELRVGFSSDRGVVQAVEDVSLELDEGELVCIVGESGCGKSVTALTIMGLTRSPTTRIEGSVRYEGSELLDAPESQLRAVRGPGIAIVFQEPVTSLNPVQRVGPQIAEQIRAHTTLDKAETRQQVIESMRRLGIPQPEQRWYAYPHELSGGMCQRVMIAMAMSCSPRLLIADECTTALDVTIQAQILLQLRSLCDDHGIGVLLITHDLGVVAEVADRVVVLYNGRVVEQGTVRSIFEDPQHPYTWGLLGSMPRLDRPRREQLLTIPGAPPEPGTAGGGCSFLARCPHAFDRCLEEPPLAPVPGASARESARCWLTPDERRHLRMVGGDIGLAPAGDVG